MLQAVLGRTTPPWVIAWTRLMTIEEAALPALAKLLDHWADQDVQMAFVGVEALQTLLLSKTPSEDRSISPEWWRLRMTALRLMGRLDEFEMVALDYCIPTKFRRLRGCSRAVFMPVMMAPSQAGPLFGA